MADQTIQIDTAIFGGGCFWGLEAVFQRVRGVRAVTCGYAGGHLSAPDHAMVCGGNSGHAEVVRIDYDPGEVAYADLLAVFFAGLQALSWSGVVTVDWGKAVDLANDLILNLKENETFTEVLKDRVPTVGALVAGYLLGFRRG